jgi:DsbC/DsbD-like thiol-disulfide interchange protein
MAKADKPDANGKQTITLTLEIEPGWHAYANPQPNPDFPARPTKVTVVGNVKADDVKIDYPKGKLKKDKMEGDYRVYEGTETIRIQIPAGKGPLTLRIEVQTCNEGMCLLPGTLTVKVP